MRAGGHLLLLLVLVAAYAPPAGAHPDPEPEVPRPLVVRWTPSVPAVGDTLVVTIEGLGTSPPPLCELDTIPTTAGSAGSMTGAWTRVVGNDLECAFDVPEDGILALTVVDIEADVYRLHGPHFFPTADASTEAVQPILGYDLDESVTAEGIVHARATAPPTLFNARTPDTMLLGGIDLVHARVNYMLLPDTKMFSARHDGPARYTLPHEIAPEIDVLASYARAEEDFDPQTEGFALVSYLTASRQNAFGLVHAFGMSEADVELYGRCALEKCLVVDG